MQNISSTILIPTYKPDHKLVNLVHNLINELKKNLLIDNCRIIIISDGNAQSEISILKCFDQEPLDIIYHAVNLGKGRSLKTGFNYALTQYPSCQSFVTADADGQHSPSDIIKILSTINNNSKIDLLLGYRDFKENVPLRSSIGNSLTSMIFNFFIGLRIKDTQTGLRAFTRKIVTHILTLSGERYEFETNVLLAAKERNWKINEIQIDTVYIENNKSSHFNPLIDSMRIYFLIFRYTVSSILSSVIDFLIFNYLTSTGVSILNATLGSRFVSGWINFGLNKHLVFKNNKQIAKPIIRYWALVIFMGIISSKLIEFIHHAGLNLSFSKLISETILFIANFSIQKEFIFNTSNKPTEEEILK